MVSVPHKNAAKPMHQCHQISIMGMRAEERNDSQQDHGRRARSCNESDAWHVNASTVSRRLTHSFALTWKVRSSVMPAN